jgi:hypothetical protein
MKHGREEAQRLFSHCVIAFLFGEPQRLTLDGAPQPRKLPNELRPIIEISYKHTAYLPATVIRILYPERKYGDASIRSLIRLLDYDCDIWEPANGINLHAKAEVFVPDPGVIDLLGAALLEPNSKLRSDLQDKEVLEPCTGTGILAITLARFGARMVRASDIDSSSISSASVNVNRNNLEDKICLSLCRGLPESQAAGMIMVNPPWYGNPRQFKGIRLGRSAQRCYLDPDHGFLTTLLETGHKTTTPDASFYLFMGKHDPLDSPDDASGGRIDVEAFAWQISDRWNGDGNIRMYRLAKLPRVSLA